MAASAHQETLGTLRAALRARLGFGSQGAAGGTNQTIIDSFVHTAQSDLYWQYDWPALRKQIDKTLGQGQTLIDYPDELEPRRLREIRVQVSGWWYVLDESEGITPWMDSLADSRAQPQACERFEQLKVWPEPDQTYTLRFDGYKRLARFTETADDCTIDSDIIFLKALADAKLHYRQPDAQVYVNDLNALLSRLRGYAHGGKRYIPTGRRHVADVMPRPILKLD